MAYDEFFADRIRNILDAKGVSYVDKKMMGGLCFMVDDKMCVGIAKDRLMCRVGPDMYEKALQEPACGEMNFTGRPMKGYVYVEPEAVDMDERLAYWVQLCLDFNPLAKSSKKKK